MIPRRPGRPIGVGVQLPEVEREVRWPELRSIARTAEAGRVRLDLGGRPPALPLRGRLDPRAVGGMDDARRPRGGDRPDRARAAGRRVRVPRPVHAREARRDRRGDLGRAAGAGGGRGLERARVRGARGPVRPADRAVRGVVHDRADAAPGRGHRLLGPVLPGAGRGAAAAAGARRRATDPGRLVGPADARGDAAPRRRRGTRGTRTRRTPRRACRPSGRSWTRRRAAAGVDPAGIERTVAVLVRMPGGAGRRSVYAAGRTGPPLEGSPEHMAEELRAYAARGDRPRPAGRWTRSPRRRSPRWHPSSSSSTAAEAGPRNPSVAARAGW